MVGLLSSKHWTRKQQPTEGSRCLSEICVNRRKTLHILYQCYSYVITVALFQSLSCAVLQRITTVTLFVLSCATACHDSCTLCAVLQQRHDRCTCPDTPVLQLCHDSCSLCPVLCYSCVMTSDSCTLCPDMCYSSDMMMTCQLRVTLCPVLHLSYDVTCPSITLSVLCYSYEKVTGAASVRAVCATCQSITLCVLCYSYDKVTGASSVHGVCATCQSPLRLSCVNCGVVKSESSVEGTAEGGEMSTLGDSSIDKDGEMLQVVSTPL